MKLNSLKTNKPFWLITIIALIIAITFSSITIAKYFADRQLDDTEITTNNFYFTTNMHGDSNSEEDLNKTHNLYGIDNHQVSFFVMNYFDDLRINKTKIDYSVSISSNNSYLPTISETGNFSFEKNIKSSKEFTITFIDGFVDDTVITVSIYSSYPFEKELTLDFILHTYTYEIEYHIEDNKDAMYATLFIKSNIDVAAGTLSIDYSLINKDSNVLMFDMLNPYLMDNGSITNEMESGESFFKKLIITNDIKNGEGFTIIIYKSDPTQNYSIEETGTNDLKIVID